MEHANSSSVKFLHNNSRNVISLLGKQSSFSLVSLKVKCLVKQSSSLLEQQQRCVYLAGSGDKYGLD